MIDVKSIRHVMWSDAAHNSISVIDKSGVRYDYPKSSEEYAAIVAAEKELGPFTNYEAIVSSDVIAILSPWHEITGLTVSDTITLFGQVPYDDATSKVLWGPIRRQRNRLLEASDWSQLTDTNGALSAESRERWATYRQELRDLTKTFASSNEVVWPIIH